MSDPEGAALQSEPPARSVSHSIETPPMTLKSVPLSQPTAALHGTQHASLTEEVRENAGLSSVIINAARYIWAFCWALAACIFVVYVFLFRLCIHFVVFGLL